MVPIGSPKHVSPLESPFHSTRGSLYIPVSCLSVDAYMPGELSEKRSKKMETSPEMVTATYPTWIPSSPPTWQ